ncbi:TPA: hypothetical protein RQL07_002383 [Vibrio vulnificus]|uniref:hypothetical protein n=1 Tax=Vibrio vulnificus TaxID=672 RepID=UPI0019D4481E|nr:hypothetical protein [Vibrio vulnificus]MBN8093701.1 hypothetical protein [Vibrio vulnificus]HAS6053690.1 hypothetical protein [Vibrio vulnificus]HAS6297460.1 hypothetical protein [Vibrio vulnificus]HDY7432068.1 hypothetical protein [Vibrio vulnificus]HDY7569566.1 hypothetical protein [Vibrio vulnificus]
MFDPHLKTALLAYFDNEVQRKVLKRQWQTGTTNNAFLNQPVPYSVFNTCLALGNLTKIIGVRLM